MASTHCFFFHAPYTTKRNPFIIVSSKTPHRKNHLRPKILKTLIKPSLHIPPPNTLLQPPQPPSIISPQENEPFLDVSDEEIHGEDITTSVGETGELEELQVSVDTAKNNVFGNVSTKDVFKYGSMYLIGAFVFQTVYYFWKLRNQHSNMRNGDLELEGSEREKRNILFDENVKAFENEVGMRKKIEEIKLLAREARRIELKKKREEEGDVEIVDESSVSSGIEKEIGERLLKLKKKINRNKDSSAASRVNGGGNSAGDGDMNVNQGKDTLVFKKKSKFKSPSTKAMKIPKGFSGSQGREVSNVKPQDYGSHATSDAGIVDGDKQVNQQDVTVTHEKAAGVPLEEGRKSVDDEFGEFQNKEKNLETPDMKTNDELKTNNGDLQETGVGMSSHEVIQSIDSRELRASNSQGFMEGNQDSDPIFEKDSVHGINYSSAHELAKHNSDDNKVNIKQANTRTDMWWSNLRYVLVILMQRGSEGEGPKGLYSLKFTSKKHEHSDDSYTVAFEDHADANNFCFILESYFDDLDDDVRANAVPMSVQELSEEIISHDEKVVVVKKRQLQLYAGQLLTDVELALCSIIEQDQNMP